MAVDLTSPIPVDLSTNADQAYRRQHQYQHRKLKMVIRHRRRLVYLRAAFQRELDRALSARLQQELALTIRLDEQELGQARFMAHFEFADQQWVLTCQHHLWRCDWFFTNTAHPQVIHCTHHTLKNRLCYALGQFQHQRTWAENSSAA
ncbi:MAG: hypothetical protein HC851_05125 [Acaryochloris sp. RU_4_1]|nr:hypothetical protein [Acaryochloris sp. RU_4_1]NJR53883.1 hypothetical protein [Acaryochloris sp. CRU_2_0]